MGFDLTILREQLKAYFTVQIYRIIKSRGLA
jgi:hypothetical protein